MLIMDYIYNENFGLNEKYLVFTFLSIKGKLFELKKKWDLISK